MGLLLFLLGLLAAVSGGFKLRPRVRALLGPSPLAGAETLAGVFTVLASGVGLGRDRPAAWTVVAGVSAVIIWSTASHVRRMARRRKALEASEGARLKRYLES